MRVSGAGSRHLHDPLDTQPQYFTEAGSRGWGKLYEGQVVYVHKQSTLQHLAQTRGIPASKLLWPLLQWVERV